MKWSFLPNEKIYMQQLPFNISYAQLQVLVQNIQYWLKLGATVTTAGRIILPIKNIFISYNNETDVSSLVHQLNVFRPWPQVPHQGESLIAAADRHEWVEHRRIPTFIFFQSFEIDGYLEMVSCMPTMVMLVASQWR